MASRAEALTIRRATPADSERIVEIVGEPNPESLGLVDDEGLARRLGQGWLRRYGDAWRHTVVAELDGEVVGVIQAGLDLPEFSMSVSVALMALRVLGPVRILRLLPRFLARNRVMTGRPEGAYYIAELDVDPRYRNRGIGGELLRHAEAQARAEGATRMALSTHTSNPARRLYERHGYRVVEKRTDAAYQRYTGIEGRVLMVKELS